MYQAEKALAPTFRLNSKNRLVWYKIVPKAQPLSDDEQAR